jgi:hypothetical protein
MLICPGIPIIWDSDNPSAVFSKYPWTRHALNKSLGYQIGVAHYDGNKFKHFSIHAMKCRSKAIIFGSACSACMKVPAKVEHLWELSNQSAERMNF